MSIGGKLYELRKKKGFSQEEVADKLNVSRQTVSKWETDQSMPDFDKIVPICELYSITTDELLLGNKKEDSEILETVSNKEEENSVKRKRALGIGISVFFYFLAVIWVMITIPVMKMNPIVSSGIFLLICGIATVIIIYTCMVYKVHEEKKPKENIDSTKQLVRQINNIISLIFVAIYLIISFITMAWHITWILWCIYACIAEIVKLIFMLRGNKNEK